MQLWQETQSTLTQGLYLESSYFSIFLFAQLRFYIHENCALHHKIQYILKSLVCQGAGADDFYNKLRINIHSLY